MSRRTKLIGAIFIILAVVSISSWPVMKWMTIQPASAALFARTKAVVEKNPRLQPAWDRAMQDGVLTFAEAKDILERAGEKVEPDE